ncbi:MAG: cytochrome c oxidase assembly protein [Pirellulales bacterium]
MNPLFDAFLRSWPYDPWLWAALLVSAVIYARGWRGLNRHDPARWGVGRLAWFLLGLAAVFLALASPIESFAGLLLQVHMLQHLLLLMLAPPFVWLGAPFLPMLRGLPKAVRTTWMAPWLRSPLARETFAGLTHPVAAWPVFVAVIWFWHTPGGYGLALDYGTWHVAQHACLIGAGLLFWYPVISPYPSRPRWSRWIVLPYLFLADVQMTVLSAWLTFAARPIYTHYTEVPRIGGWSALEDQNAAGVLMWVPGSIAFLVPMFWIGLKMLYGSQQAAPRKAELPAISLPVIAPAASGCPRSMPASPRRRNNIRWDLLEVPLMGRLLRRPTTRPALQLVMLALAALVILDGLFGPNMGPANLAGVAPWIHWRGLVVLGLLVGGNFFCMACPFTLPRKLAARWFPAGRAWPRWLQNKWLAVALLALFLWSYEALALWDSPWLSAWIAIAYFAAAFVVDVLFRGSSFCKYVCPIGQFNFVQSLVSPLEVKVREPAVCAGCQTKECIRGSAAVAGCGMDLFQPLKRGNLDCTFCLDCVRACPHENVGVFATLGAKGLSDVAAFRSGLGRLSRRGDVAVLVLVLVFGAFANAAGMIAPVVEWQDALVARLGDPPLIVVISLFYWLALVVAPLVLIGAAASLCRLCAKLPGTSWRVATRYVYALVPLGFGMWLAHHGFHLFTSYATIVPVTQRMSLDFGLAALGDPQWQRACCAGVAPWIVRFELLSLDFGLLVSLLVAYHIAAGDACSTWRTVRAFAPWGLVIVVLFAAGVWIVTEPMQMRGTLPMGG